MFRSKADVDRHVQDILGKIHNENERNLRGHSFARLYYQIKDFETAKKYLVTYLSVRDHHAPAHILLGQIYEGIGNIEKALHSYKRCLEVDCNQKEIMLKICELYCKIPIDHETARYWADRTEVAFPHHEIVFQLRECLVSAEGEPDRKELERLIAQELSTQPLSVNLRIKLLKLYLDTERVKEAYFHAMKVETKRPFSTSTDWYHCLVDIFEAYQEEIGLELDSDFYINFLSALDHLVSLTLTESHALRFGYDPKPTHSSSINDAASVLYLFDCVLKSACDKDLAEGPWLYVLHHMKGQLYYHMGTLITKRAIKDQGNWKEACRVGAALFLVSYSFKPQNLLQEVWFSRMNERQKLFTNFFQQAALRTSCCGHIITTLCKEEKSKWLQKIKNDVCLAQVQGRTYSRLFGCNAGINLEPLRSYFLHDASFLNATLEFPSTQALRDYDKSAYKLCCDSLHHLVWLQLHQSKESDENSLSHETHLSEIFKGLQYGNNNLSKGSSESLCLLDLEAYLQATVYTISHLFDLRSAVVLPQSSDAALSVSPEISEPLCTEEQATWWKAAYYLFTNSVKDKLGDYRQILQRGLEIIRGIGNHGLDVQLVVYLARLFGEKAASCVTTKNKNAKCEAQKIYLDHRCAHYWNIALGMLQKLEQNRCVRTPKEFMFANQSKDLSSDEILKLIEEGHLYLACQQMNAGKLEEAVSTFSKLTSPFASYYMALSLKRSALQEVEDKSMRDIDAKTWNIRTALLNKAKEAMYLTMDRLKGDKTHPLNQDLVVDITDIERELNKDLNSSAAVDDSVGSDEADDYDDVDNKQMSPVNSGSLLQNHLTRLSRQSTPRPDSSFLLRKKGFNVNEKFKHVQPSPERLDAQIRSLTLNQDTLVKTMLDQQQTLIDTTKAMAEEQRQNKQMIEQLKKQMEELCITVAKGFARYAYRKYARDEGEDEEEDFPEFEGNAGYADYFVDDNGEFEFRRGGYQHYMPPQLVTEAPGPSGLAYAHQAAVPAVPTGHPQLNHYGYQYPPHPTIAPPPPPAGGALPDHHQYFHSSPAQGLSFSEGQQLPQFRFHVGSPAVKSPIGTALAPAVQPLSATPMSPSIAALAAKPQPLAIQPQVTPPWGKSGAVPHEFQIPLHPVPTNAESPSSQPPTILTTPSPYYSSTATSLKSVSTTRSPSTVGNKPVLSFASTSPFVNNSIGSPVMSPLSSSYLNRTGGNATNRSRKDSDIGERSGSEAEGHDVEREVLGDFKPLIPLPDEVAVETGEEDEKVLFEERAKLFRFVEHEWKERGIGPVRLLHNESTGKVRLLMRRDQVLKVCANHFILPAMQLTPMKDSDKAWIWAAQDFADETVRTEKLCIRFKTSDIASLFKRTFDQSVEIVTKSELDQANISGKDNRVQVVLTPLNITMQSPNTFGSKFLPKHGSWMCPVCLVNNVSDKPSCIACDTTRPQQSTLKSPSNLNVSPQSSNTAALSFGGVSLGGTSVTYKTGDGNVTITAKTVDKPTDQPASALLKHLATSPQSVTPELQRNSSVSGSAKTVLGGFTFCSPPVLKESSPEAKDREILVVHTKAKNGPQVTKIDAAKPSPFSGFSFRSPSAAPVGFAFSPSITTKSDAAIPPTSSDAKSALSLNAETKTLRSNVVSSVSSTVDSQKSNHIKPSLFDGSGTASNLSFTALSNSPSSLSFGKSENFQGISGKGSPLVVTVTKDGRRVSNEFSTDTTAEEFEPTAEFQPVVPLPALVEVKTGEEEEEKLFGERAKLFRYDKDGKQWKERGLGELKILHLPSKGRYRILMRREQVLKICANHNILPDMKLSPLASSDKSWVWLAQDYSEGTLCEEQFAAKFKNSDTAKLFRSVFEACQEKIRGLKSNLSDIASPIATVPNNQKPLSEVFKPQPGTWECGACYVRNDAAKQQCISCSTLNPSSIGLARQSQLSTTSCKEIKKSYADLFKSDSSTWECQICKTQNDKDQTLCSSCKMGKPESDSCQSSSELYKPAPGSWECNSCYVRNDASKQCCISCDAARYQNNAKDLPSDSTSRTVNEPKNTFVFKPDPSLWECQACYVRNNKESISCVSCETAKPGSEAEHSITAPTSVFGQLTFTKNDSEPSSTSDNIVFGSNSQPVPPKSGFLFGSKPSAAAMTFHFGQSSVSQPAKEGFEFKSGNILSNTNSPSTIFGGANISSNFGSPSSASIPIPPVTAAPTYVFGSSTNSYASHASKNEDEDAKLSGFRFGSPQKYEFNFSGVRARSPTKAPKSPKTPGTPTDVEEEDEVEPSDVDNIYFQPVIPLPPKVDVKTGEENEDLVFSHRGKLFRYDNGEWRERGIGDIKILYNSTIKSYRLLMRREQVLKVCLNHKLTGDIKFIPKGDKSLQWAATDFSDNEPKPEQLAIRFKTPETLTEFKKAVDESMNLLSSGKAGNNVKASIPAEPQFQEQSSKTHGKSATPSSGTTVFQSPVNASSFSFKTEGQSQNSPFSLSTRFGESKLPARSLFGSSSNMTEYNSLSSGLSFGKSGDKDIEVIEVIESKAATEEQRESAEKLQLPSNFYLYEDKEPCSGCRGCDTGNHVREQDDIEIISAATPSAAQIEAANKLLLPPSFYLYENKPPCPGCRGCRDEIPDHIGFVQPDEEKEVEIKSEELSVPTTIVSEPGDISDEKPFFASTSFSSFSFADLASKELGFEALAAKTSPSKVVFAGAGTPVFGALNDTNRSEDYDEDKVIPAPDIHFKPAIPLPDLVEVKTGEEDETPVFCHRGKLYKYDSSVHQWKERGIGDFKILKHNQNSRFRIVLRRELVHKIACNHNITPDMKVSPMGTSDTALCWNAVDYAGGAAETANFAVRFKLQDTLKLFREKFEECVSVLSLEVSGGSGQIQSC